jgi:hypothetical protein
MHAITELVDNMEKLTDLQWELLDSICHSNGGGVSLHTTADRKRAQSLYRKGLAQGKAGQQYKAVHTADGLKLWRERAAART